MTSEGTEMLDMALLEKENEDDMMIMKDIQEVSLETLKVLMMATCRLIGGEEAEVILEAGEGVFQDKGNTSIQMILMKKILKR